MRNNPFKTSKVSRVEKGIPNLALRNLSPQVIAERKKSLQKEIHPNLVVGEPSNDEMGSKIRRPLLDQLIIEQRKNPQLLPDEGILEEVNTFMFAVSILISFVLA